MFMMKRRLRRTLIVFVSLGVAIIGGSVAERVGFPTDSTPERTSPEAARAGWVFHVIDNRGNGADGVAVADINGDGNPDVAGNFQESGIARLYLNPGAGGVRDPWSAVDIANSWGFVGIEDVSFADLNGDSRPDAMLLAMDWPGSRLGLSRLIDPDHPDRPGAWSTSFLTPWYSGLFLKVRAITAPKEHLAHLFAGSHSNHFYFPHAEAAVERSDLDLLPMITGKPRILERITKTDLLETFDVDRDGLADLVVADDQRFGWFSNPGATEATAPWVYYQIGVKIKQFAFCDMNGDGIPDIVGAAAKSNRPADVVGYWYEASAVRPGDFTEHSIRIAGKNPGANEDYGFKGIACGDLDGDGVPDLVFTGSGPGYGVFILTRASGSTPDQAVWTVIPITPWSLHRKYDNVVLADLDGDGDLDIVTTDETDGDFTRGLGVVWFENRMTSLRPVTRAGWPAVCLDEQCFPVIRNPIRKF
jgi:hypothetical protein